MKTIIKSSIAAMMLLIFTFFTNAQEAVPEAITNLMKMVGHWEGKSTMTMDGKTMEADYHCTFEKTSDGKGFIMKEWVETPNMGTYKSTNLIGYNQNDGKIHWYSVDNMGTTTEITGKWNDTKNLIMEGSFMMGGKKMDQKVDAMMKEDDKTEVNISIMTDGKEFQKINLAIAKVEACTEK